MMPRWLVNSCLPVLLLMASCGDDGSGGGFGAIGGAFGGGSGSEPTSFLYVTNRDSNNISGFSINTTTGGLVVVPGAPFPTDSGPAAIAVSSNGFVYVANGSANKITAYGVSPEGRLVAISSTGPNSNPVPVDPTPSALAISTDEKFLYVASISSGTVTTFSIGTGGVLTRVASVGGLGSAPNSLALSQDGKFVYAGDSGANEITAFSIDSSGLLTKIAPVGANTNPLSTGGTGLQGIAASPTASFLYAVHTSSNTVVTFRMESNGLLTRVPASGGRPNPFLLSGAAPSRVLLSRNGRFVYSANGDGTMTTFTIGGDGLLSLAPASVSISPGTLPVGMTLSPDGQYLYVANSGGRVSAFTVAADTGLLTPLNPLVGSSFSTGTSPSGIAAVGSP